MVGAEDSSVGWRPDEDDMDLDSKSEAFSEEPIDQALFDEQPHIMPLRGPLCCDDQGEIGWEDGALAGGVNQSVLEKTRLDADIIEEPLADLVGHPRLVRLFRSIYAAVVE